MKQLLYFILSIIIIINQKTLYCSGSNSEQYNADNLYEKFIDKKQDLTSISSSNKNLENNNEIEMVDRWFKIDTTSELLFVLKESGESYKQLMRIYEFANAEPNNTIKKYINENYLINPIRIGFCLLCFQEISNIDKSILNYVLNAFINYIINDVYPGSYVPKILFYMNNDFNTDIGNAILLRIKEEKNKGKKISLTLLLFKYREFYRLPKEQRYKHYDIIIDYLQDLSLVITCQLDCGNFFDEEYITNKLRRRNGGASGAICLILLINNTLYRYDNIQKSIYFDIIDTDCKKIIKNEIIVKCKNHTTNNKINILDIMQLSRNRIRSTLQKELEGIPFNQLKESYLMLLLTKNKQDSLSQNEQHVLIESLDKEIKNIEDENSIYNNMKCFSVTRNMAINIIEYYIQSITSKKQFIPYLLDLRSLNF